MYDKKHRQIVERQRQIGEQLEESREADSEFKMALSGLLSLATKAADLFESSNLASRRVAERFMKFRSAGTPVEPQWVKTVG